ncbi:hypothetical protein ACGK9R_16710 [Halomonas sp. HNIBRBA4712]|uniref:alginate O-acetyltransferase AlgX-related protein n=1 Tax=Halomonas sp. HNIBRBA4712 TaxID=3373087 RepID=UPI003744F6EC
MNFDNIKQAQRSQENWWQQLMGGSSSSRPLRAEQAGLQWHLDYPSQNRPIKLAPGGIVVLGWVLLPPSLGDYIGAVEVVARWSEPFEVAHPLNVERSDVVERVLGANADDHPQRRCGFRFTIPHTTKAFELELLIQGERLSLERVIIDSDAPEGDPLPPLKVLEGKEGWLFLDNDTNGSVDQYCGNMRLTEKGVTQWQRYLQGFASLALKHRAKTALLISPSKESVMGPCYHPMKEGLSGPIHQLLALPEASSFLYPVGALRALGDDAFIRTDSHWTSRGAMAAVQELAKAFDFDQSEVGATFAEDEYQSRTFPGDLGSKFDPVRTCTTDVLCSFSYLQHRYFDNGLPNFGRLLLVTYPNALRAATCVMFGSSSSYFMLNYLSRLFSRVVFVHTAGNLDPELIAAIKPEYLVVQTNARFVVQVPKTRQALSALIEDKRARLTPAEQELLTKRQVSVNENDSLIETLGLSPWVSL